MERHVPASGVCNKTLDAAKKKGERFLLAFEHAPIGMLISDFKGRFVWANQASAELLGYSVQELTVMNFQEITYSEDLNKDMSLVSELLQGKKPRFVMEKRFVRADGEIIHVMLYGSLARGARNRPVNFVVQIVDVTERKNYEQAMLHMAYHDQLTGLPNRILFQDKLSMSLSQARANQDMLAVIFLDLDRFKIINDTMGHYIGDQALKTIAGRLISSVRNTDLVARLGGDEFTVVLPNVSQEQDVYKVLQKIMEFLEAPLWLNEKEFIVSASVGIALHPRDGQDVDTLLQVADKAMYISKRKKGVEDSPTEGLS